MMRGRERAARTAVLALAILVGGCVGGTSGGGTATWVPGIYVVDLQGGREHIIDSTSATGYDPDWSPDGTKIVFNTDLELFVVPAEGGGNSRLQFGDYIEFPSWSPDGALIVYLAGASEKWFVNIIDPEGVERTQLTGKPTDYGRPAWAPDGRSIVVSSLRDDPAFPGCSPCNSDIYVIPVDGTSVQRLTRDPAPDEDPLWSPDGTKIAFVRPSETRTDIYLMASDGSGIRLLAHGSEPAWSPDGRRIAFTTSEGLQVINADGSGQTTAAQPESGVRGPAWSPDGRSIAFASDGIYVVGADGGGLRRLSTIYVDGNPAWSPDGTRIVFGRPKPFSG